MPTYSKFVFDEIRRIGQAFKDKNPDSFPELNDAQLKHIFEKIGDMSWRRLVNVVDSNPSNGKSMRQILTEIGVNPDDYGELPVPPIPIPQPPSGDLTKQPRNGLSLNAILNNTKINIDETVKRFVDVGANSTRINLITALFDNEYGKIDCLPFNQRNDGKWDLYSFNSQYYDRLKEVKEKMNSNGIQIQWTNYELYSWSKRKPGVQQNNTPWRNNINNVFWDERDLTFDILPDQWSKDWFNKICPLLNLDVNSFEIGNEFPEKLLHERVRDYVRGVVPNALIQVNRNEDTPGQYTNMKIGTNYDFISFHGNKLKEINDLNRVYSDEPTYKTFQQFIIHCPHTRDRVTFSSDGARISNDPVNTYDWNKLREWFYYLKSIGYGIEHQSRAKMTPAPNHHMIEVDWFHSVVT